MKRWFYNFILTPRLSRFEGIGIGAAVGPIVASPNFDGALVSLSTLIGTAAIVAITTAIKDTK